MHTLTSDKILLSGQRQKGMDVYIYTLGGCQFDVAMTQILTGVRINNSQQGLIRGVNQNSPHEKGLPIITNLGLYFTQSRSNKMNRWNVGCILFNTILVIPNRSEGWYLKTKE